jgi:hypothetical protein
MPSKVIGPILKSSETSDCPTGWSDEFDSQMANPRMGIKSPGTKRGENMQAKIDREKSSGR